MSRGLLRQSKLYRADIQHQGTGLFSEIGRRTGRGLRWCDLVAHGRNLGRGTRTGSGTSRADLVSARWPDRTRSAACRNVGWTHRCERSQRGPDPHSSVCIRTGGRSERCRTAPFGGGHSRGPRRQLARPCPCLERDQGRKQLGTQKPATRRAARCNQRLPAIRKHTRAGVFPTGSGTNAGTAWPGTGHDPDPETSAIAGAAR